MCCKEVEDSCPVEGQSGWSLLVPYTFGFAQAGAVESAQDVAQVSDFIQKSLSPSDQSKWEPFQVFSPACPLSSPSVLAAGNISGAWNENLRCAHPRSGQEPGGFPGFGYPEPRQQSYDLVLGCALDGSEIDRLPLAAVFCSLDSQVLRRLWQQQ